MSVYYVCTWCPHRPKEGIKSCGWSYRWFINHHVGAGNQTQVRWGNKTKQNQLVLLSTESSQPSFWIIVPMELCVIHCCVSSFFGSALHWWDSPPCCCSHGLFILTSGPCFTFWMCPSLFPHYPLVERQWCLCLELVWAKLLQPFYTYTPLLIHRYANFPKCIPRSGIWDCMMHIGSA